MFFLFFWRQWNEGFRNITHDPKWSCNSKFETWVAFICFIFPVTSSQCTKLKNALNSEFLLGECYQVLRIGRQYFLTDILPRITQKALLRKYSDIFSPSGETGPVLAEQRILTGWVMLGSKYSVTFEKYSRKVLFGNILWPIFFPRETSPVLAEGEERRDYYGNEEAPNQSSDRGEFLINCTLSCPDTVWG